ncbi:MAG: chemotaxis protein CheW [Reichenbachiella sp.]
MALGKNLKKDTLIPSKKKKKKEEGEKPVAKSVDKKKVKVGAKNAPVEKVATKKNEPKKVESKKSVVKNKVEKIPNPVPVQKVEKEEVESSVIEAPAEMEQTLSPAQAILKAEQENPETVAVPDVVIEEELEEPNVEVIEKVVKEEKEALIDVTHSPKLYEGSLMDMQRDIIKKQIGTIKYLTEEEHKERERLKVKFDKDISSYAGKDIQLITFKLGIETYAIEIDKVKEVVPTPYISAIPHAPTFIKGVSNIRGAVMVILDLADKFKVDAKGQTKEFVLVTQSGNSRAGLLVNEVPITMKVSGDTIVSSSGILQNTSLDETYIKGLIKTEDGMIIFIDIAELIKEDEVSIVSGSIM